MWKAVRDIFERGSNSRNISRPIMVSALLFAILIGLGLSYSRYKDTGTDGAADKKSPRLSLLYSKEELFTILQKGNQTGTFKVGETAALGDLQITVFEANDGTYKSLDLDADNKRIYKNYFKARVRIFNPGIRTDEIIVGLEDDLGNQYITDNSITIYLDGVPDFGWAKNVISQTLREGHLLFPPIPAEARKLKLTFMSEVSNEKIIFEIPR